MLGLAPSLGCASSTDYMCLCDSADFGYGVRDCSVEACPAGTDTNVIFQFLVGLCSGQFGSISSSATSGGTTTSATGGGSTVSGTLSAGSTGPNAAIAVVTVGVPYSSDASAFQSLSTASGSAGGGSPSASGPEASSASASASSASASSASSGSSSASS